MRSITVARGAGTVLRLAGVGLLSIVAGCSTHPLPEDFALRDTYAIVRQIRCEARAGLEEAMVEWLTRRKRVLKLQHDDPPGAALEAEVARRLGFPPDGSVKPADFRADPRTDISFGTLPFPQYDQAVVSRFGGAAIAYNFTFDMSEVNNLDASFDFLGILRHTVGSAALSGGLDRTRQNIRTFTLTDTFVGLLDMHDAAAYCENYVPVHNVVYPITGRIGVAEIIVAFVNLSLFSNLASGDGKGPPSMSDAIAFTTRLAGALTPKLVLAPAFRGAQLADASISATLSRTDLHKVIVAVAEPQPPSTADKDDRKPVVNQFNTTFITAVGSPAELLAARAIDQVIFRFELGRAGATALTPQ